MTSRISEINITSSSLVISYSKGSINPDKSPLTAVLKALSHKGETWYDIYTKSCDGGFKADSSCNGITFKGNRVTSIDGYKGNLEGYISSEIGNLTKLEYLDMSDNKLTGELPKSIGNLKGLTWLYLGDNCLTLHSDTVKAIKDLNIYNEGSSTYFMDNNCIPIGTLKGITRTNCNQCNYCQGTRACIGDIIWSKATQGYPNQLTLLKGDSVPLF